jgi:hypothetical protein
LVTPHSMRRNRICRGIWSNLAGQNVVVLRLCERLNVEGTVSDGVPPDHVRGHRILRAKRGTQGDLPEVFHCITTGF